MLDRGSSNKMYLDLLLSADARMANAPQQQFEAPWIADRGKHCDYRYRQRRTPIAEEVRWRRMSDDQSEANQDQPEKSYLFFLFNTTFTFKISKIECSCDANA